MNIDIALDQALTNVRDLYNKYKDDDYMILKTHNYICFQIQSVLENMKKTHDISQARIKEMTQEQDAFIQNFFTNHQYFYVPLTEIFIMYDGVNYHIQREDDILHHVLITISKERQLMPWKKSTKVGIMKRIKETPIFKTVPESDTIQHVLDLLYPSLFYTRDEAKYFLTVIGDNILRKNSEIVHFITPKAKPFIRELNNIAQLVFGINANHTIKYKYYLHDYDVCRLVNISHAVQSENVWGAILQKSALDMLCVACHYSVRYHSSDEYALNHSNDESLGERVFYMQHNSPQSLVTAFVGEYFQPRGELTPISGKPNIEWKDVMYLWKHFLDVKQIPNIMFQPSLKKYMKELMGENYHQSAKTEQTPTPEYIEGYTSKYLPTIQLFLAFWNETVVIEPNEVLMEYEIDELCMLFKRWCDTQKKHHTIPDVMMLDLIQYYYTGITIENNKNVVGIRCIMWDKQMDVQTALNEMSADTNEAEGEAKPLKIVSSYSNLNEHVPPLSPTSQSRTVSVNDAYVWYCKYYSELENKRPLVSKYYFEKYLEYNDQLVFCQNA